MGEADAPTELSGITEAETRSGRAWGLAEDAPTEFRDQVPGEAQQSWSIDDGIGEPDIARASWRRVAAIGAAIVVAAASVAGGIVAWDRYHKPSVSATTIAAEPGRPAPESSPSWHLNGTYRVDIRNPEGVMYDLDGTATKLSEYRLPIRSNWVAYKTECEPAGCTAHSVLLDDVTHQNAANLDEDLARHQRGSAMRWNGTEWATAGGGPHGGTTDTLLECDDHPGAFDTWETWSTLSPLPDGSFRGTSYRSPMTNKCGITIDQMEVPVVAVRIGDAPPGIFDVSPG